MQSVEGLIDGCCFYEIRYGHDRYLLQVGGRSLDNFPRRAAESGRTSNPLMRLHVHGWHLTQRKQPPPRHKQKRDHPNDAKHRRELAHHLGRIFLLWLIPIHSTMTAPVIIGCSLQK